MSKQLSKAYLLKAAKEELKTLADMMDYAERMIREGSLEYRGLRREAYGKAVCVTQECGEETVYRLGMDSITYPKKSSGYATPHSPVGRLCSVVGLGFEGFSQAWGVYYVSEVRRFRRHAFEELDRQARNFQAMGVEREDGEGKVLDVRAFVEARAAATKPVPLKGKAKVTEADGAPNDKGHAEQTIRPAAESSSDTAHPEETIVSTQAGDTNVVPARGEQQESLPVPPLLEILEDDDDEGETPVTAQFDLDSEGEGEELSEYIGLDEDFFLNRTMPQDKIISRAPVGPMWVEGVAGSGKTSAALGRTKMLCDFNSNDVSDREVFRSILGDDFDYWEGRFAGRFSQEGSVGFVRTAELIQYLKETCSRLGMSDLPVLEYHELRSRLRNQRKLESSGGSGKGFKHSAAEAHPLTTSLSWLIATTRAVARVIAHELRQAALQLNSAEQEKFSAHQRGLFSEAVRGLTHSVEELCQQLESPLGSQGVLHGLVKQLLAQVRSVAERTLGVNVLSVHLEGHLAYGSGLPELASALSEVPIDFFLSQNSVLVLYHEADSCGGPGTVNTAEVRPCASSAGYEFLDANGISLRLGEALQKAKGGQTVSVRITSLNSSFPASFMPASELFIRLSHSAPLLFRSGNGLKRLKISTGVGSQVAEGIDSPSRVFTREARNQLIKPLKNFARLYGLALDAETALFPDAAVAGEVLERLRENVLSDADIDLLLCLAHDLSVGVQAKSLPSGLHAPVYYQSVFVDEVQDFTEQQIYLMTSLADPEFSAITVVGDRSQQLLRNEPMHIGDCFPVGRRPEFIRLEENLRQKSRPELAAFSTMLRCLFEQGAEMDVQALNDCLLDDRDGDESAYTLKGFSGRDTEFEYLSEVIASIPEDQTVAVVLPDQSTARALHSYCEQRLEGSFRKMSISEHIDLAKKYLVHFTSVLNVKGLEFDVVLLPMIEMYDLAQPIFRNRLYVGCTRARKRLVMTRLRP
ncbi:ATP-binding domain-containing protein [Pseudomonas resinovorans]|uniref:ATP-binding domain-containing protein n=1 Tax=Metapseudomonas resinovorans TaxID=53412 RepID=UPI00237FC99A|nr:ATP-binding domain-containing protein [Pseudomonas resinovorans]MDE3735920.1 ATP-binding domain-containing protein [Pseudomonas resinovorans]